MSTVYKHRDQLVDTEVLRRADLKTVRETAMEFIVDAGQHEVGIGDKHCAKPNWHSVFHLINQGRTQVVVWCGVGSELSINRWPTSRCIDVINGIMQGRIAVCGYRVRCYPVSQILSWVRCSSADCSIGWSDKTGGTFVIIYRGQPHSLFGEPVDPAQIGTQICRYGSQCRNAFCTWQHVNENGGINHPCRDQKMCRNNRCPFRHFNPRSSTFNGSTARAHASQRALHADVVEDEDTE
jgi:hypothetical protein